MTRFRLSAGRPAPSHRSGPSARRETEPEEIKRVRDWAPNREPLTPLACGCKIPWPLFTLIGSASRGQNAPGDHGGRQVHCDEHGWQRVTEDTIKKAKKRAKSHVEGQTELPPF